MDDPDLENFLTGVVGWVEASSYEQHCLWKEWHLDGNLVWIENLSGLGREVGRIDDRPIFISLRTALVDGHKLLFVDPTSVVVDHDQIEQWLRTKLPPEAYCVRSDAQNFPNVLYAAKAHATKARAA